MTNRTSAALALGGAALGILFLAANACAEEASPNCGPLADARREIAEAGAGKLKPLSHEQLNFARGLFVASPPVSPYPPGDEGMMAMFESGASTVVFVEGDKACGKMGLSPSVTAILIDLDKSI
ncbi:MAG TPA: hypothetical protein VKS78_04510 [Roseiarcus sp.]|nr:hypothetical protein [Roseiarcus sp.]